MTKQEYIKLFDLLLILLQKLFLLFSKLKAPEKLNLSDELSRRRNVAMEFIYEKTKELRSKNIPPPRKIKLIETDFKVEKEALKGVRFQYIFEDSSFEIETLYVELVKNAIENGFSKSLCWESVVKYKYEVMNNCCNLIFKLFRSTENGFITYAHCEFPTCNKLKFEARYNEDNCSMKVVVLSNNETNTEITHIKKTDGSVLQRRQQLRSFERLKVQQELQTTNAFPLRSSKISTLQSAIPNRDTIGVNRIPSAAVLRTAKSQMKTLLNRDVDPFIDLILMKKENEDLIKFISMPLSVDLFYLPACKYYKSVKKHDVVYFDASGGMCGHPYAHENSKRIKEGKIPLPQQKVLFYTTIAEKNSALLPLQMLITEDHTALNIAYHLKKFRLECTKAKIWPIFRKVIIDFSDALKIGINMAYNDFAPCSTTLSYLNYCHEVITHTTNLKPHFIIPQACCAHLAKIISIDLNKNFPGIKKRLKHFIQECMAYATTTSDMASQEKWWEIFCIIIGSKKYTPAVSQSIRFMLNVLNVDWSKTISETPDKNMQDILITHQEKTIYRNSPFYQHFKKLSDGLNATLCNDAASDNEFHVPGLIEHFLGKYMYETCFWTNSMGCLVESEGKFEAIHFYAQFKVRWFNFS